MVRERTLEACRGLRLQPLERVDLLPQVRRGSQLAQARANELANGHRAAQSRDRRLHGKERLVPALAHLRRGAHVDDGLVDASGGRALRGIDANHLVQANARLVVRELQRVAQQQVEQCSRRLPSDEVTLRVQTLERCGGGVDQPLRCSWRRPWCRA